MPDRNKKTNSNTKKEKTNQYINETELKSLIIRINNTSFKNNLYNAFKRLDKYLSKLHNAEKMHKSILEKAITKTISKIVSNRYKQLLLIPDDGIKRIKTLIDEYEKTSESNKCRIELFDEIKSLFAPIHHAMISKTNLLCTNATSDNFRLQKYIKKHSKSKSQKLKKILRKYIILLSERNIIDKNSYERFGEMVLLIIKNILKKPKFSGYTYRDEFYSDSTDKILRYIKNFNHKMISDITGQEVNAFSYLSQYVHNSILFIINTKNAEKQEVEKYVNTYNENIRLLYNETSYECETNILEHEIKKIKTSLYDDIICDADMFESYTDIRIYYPEEYRISLEEYNKLIKLKELLNKHISVIRKRN